MILKKIGKQEEAAFVARQVTFAITTEEHKELKRALDLVVYYKKSALGALSIQEPIGDIISFDYDLKKDQMTVRMIEGMLG